MSGYARVGHSLPTSERVAWLMEYPEGAAALGAWTMATVIASRDETDGRVTIASLAFMADRSLIDTWVTILEHVGLVSREGRCIVLTDYLEHNASRAQIDSVREKRRAAGTYGGKQNASRLLQQRQSKQDGAATALLKQPISVSVSDSVSVFVSDLKTAIVEQEGSCPPEDTDAPEAMTAAAPPWLRIRSAAVTGYREAYERRFAAMPTDIVGAQLEDSHALVAIERRARHFGEDPEALARRVASQWVREKPDGQRPPKWRWFVQDVGDVLARYQGSST